jgi:hypothetical protein
MKKVFLAMGLISIFAISAYAYGVLTGSETNGINKTCYYSDGSAKTVFAGSICPVSTE